MDSILKQFSLKFLSVILLASSWPFFSPVNTIPSDYDSLVYNICANQTYGDYYATNDHSHSQTLSSLFQRLLLESSHSKFFKATSGDENIGISGHFQCRGDLGDQDCQSCVNALQQISNSLCRQAVAARIQLNGCYFQYETDGFTTYETSKQEVLQKICSENKAAIGGFEEARDAAFVAMQSRVMNDNNNNNNKRFYEMEYEHVHVMAQCEDDLGACDCGECVAIAGQVAQEECGASVSGHVYLDQCFLSYAYNPDGGIPGNSHQDQRNGGNANGKTAAIALGVAAALFVGFIILRFMKSSCKKKDDI